jgi:tetratricopeptide (TPR) repeat protein
VQTGSVSLFVCLAVATGAGTWYLHSRVPDNQWRLADETGQQSMYQGRHGEAERHFTMAVEAARGFGDRDPRLGLSLSHLAQALVAQSKYLEALRFLERSVLVHENALGIRHPEVALLLENHAAVLHKLDRTAEAEVIARRAAMIRSLLNRAENKAR